MFTISLREYITDDIFVDHPIGYVNSRSDMEKHVSVIRQFVCDTVVPSARGIKELREKHKLKIVVQEWENYREDFFKERFLRELYEGRTGNNYKLQSRRRKSYHIHIQPKSYQEAKQANE